MSPEPALGARLRELRLERGLGLRETARRAGISHGLLSQVETGRSQPSVATLARIGTALGVPIFDDVFERPSPPPGGGRVVRGAERKALESYSPAREWLVTPTSDDTFTVFFTVLPVGADSGGAYSHLGGQEVLYVLSGEVEFTVEGELWLLAAGDAITLRATEEHGWRNPSDDPAEVLWIVERPGDGPRD